MPECLSTFTTDSSKFSFSIISFESEASDFTEASSNGSCFIVLQKRNLLCTFIMTLKKYKDIIHYNNDSHHPTSLHLQRYYNHLRQGKMTYETMQWNTIAQAINPIQIYKEGLLENTCYTLEIFKQLFKICTE